MAQRGVEGPAAALCGRSLSNERLELMDSEKNMARATFFAALLILLVNVVTAAANWMAYFDRAQVFSAVAQLEQRLVVIEAKERQRDMQQYTPPPLPQTRP